MAEVGDARGWRGHAQLFSELVTFMGQDSKGIFRAAHVHAVAKYLERIGDDATNLAEMVVFMVKGKEVRRGKG